MYFKFSLLVFVICYADGVRRVIEVEGDINVALLIDNCQNYTEEVPARLQSLVSSAVWTTRKVNILELLTPLRLGLSVYETCSESDYFKTIFDLYQHEETYLLGLINDKKLSEKVVRFCDLLDVRTIQTSKYKSYLIKASIQFLSALGWVENITILAPDDDVIKQFYIYSKTEFICIRECITYRNDCPHVLNTTNPFVFFGNKLDIEQFLKFSIYENFGEVDALFVPLDGSTPAELPVKSYVIIPPHDPPTRSYKEPVDILPSPILFEVAKPILSYVTLIEIFIRDNCNDTQYKVNCLRNKFKKKYHPILITQTNVTDTLKIESLRPNFVYNIFRVENGLTNTTQSVNKNNPFQTLTKIFTYNIFGNNLTLVAQNYELDLYNASSSSTGKCFSIYADRNFKYVMNGSSDLTFRSESWVFTFLSLSLLGVLFCISVLIFILVCICRRDILEGNPILTLSLLLAVMLLFCSVLPFSLKFNNYTNTPLCLAKSLSLTLGYALVFSLLLSRCILLATASKEIGFMSHIAGPVQAFLCLFIFGVQAALSLQIIGRCLDIFRAHSFLYLMSYNTMLLMLLLCLCPLIYKCQRNYREGKYFTIAIILTSCAWFIWMPLYGLLEDNWKEPMLCFGLVSTAGILLVTIFIPRTYLMTIAAARDKITSTLPSLATANSTMDIYRANTQPIYDCVNVAAINAVAVARAGVTVPTMQTIQRPDLYSCPALPEDDEFDFRCDTPPSVDKVTRF